MSFYPEEAQYKAMSKLVNHLGDEMTKYGRAVESAYRFAEGLQGESWNGGFTMGLTLAGLTLIPINTMIEPKPYWVKAPEPKENTREWDTSWIAENNAFTERQVCLSKTLIEDLKKCIVKF